MPSGPGSTGCAAPSEFSLEPRSWGLRVPDRRSCSTLRRLLLAAVVLSLLSYPAAVEAKPPPGCQKAYGRADYHSVAKRAFDGKARATRFEARTLRKVVWCQRAPGKSGPIIARHQRRYRAHHKRGLLWVYYKAHPMPTCTWLYESGEGSGPEWAPSPRYRVPNASGSAASGKFQIMDGTWTAYGGTYRGWHSAAASPPLEQEKIARRVYAGQGIGAWQAC